MADYTNSTKVKSMFRSLNTASANAAITEAEIAIFIDEAEAEINGKLYEYYEVPILIGAAPISNAIISKAATLKVAHLVRGILDSVGQTSEKEKAVNFDQQANMIIKDCIPTVGKDGEWINSKTNLYDATKKLVGPENDSTLVASLNSGDDGPTFQKGVDKW